ncbi:MAG: helix-turn-helix transcriptional regulator [Bacteroidales bacterium]|jgi:transcriptional regulator with XRE-family HTH domain
MTDRILEIIKYLHISPSDFAEEIGVQRSSISHLISGRNKASLEFVQKILSRYPEINIDWLLNGNGQMLNKQLQTTVKEELPFETEKNDDVMEPSIEPEKPKNQRETMNPEAPKIPLRKKLPEPYERQVEKIIYLYKDKTFREYYPE